MKRHLALISLCAFATMAQAEGGATFSLIPHVSSENPPFDDFFIHGDITVAPKYSRLKTSFHLGVGVRPGAKKVLTEYNESLYLLREHRISFELFAEKDFMFTDIFGLYVQGGGAISNGWNRGSEIDIQDGLSPILGGGVLFSSEGAGYLKLGYVWQDQKVSSPHGIRLSITFLGGN